MSITKAQATALKRAVSQVVRAELAYSWRGAGDPEDVPFIESDHKLCLIKLSTMINRLTEKTQPS